MYSAAATEARRLNLFDDEPSERVTASAVRLPESLWKELTRIARIETRVFQERSGSETQISRNDVIRKMLERAVASYDVALLEKKSKK